MTNKAALTKNSKVICTEQFYYAPTALISVDGNNVPVNTIYCFLSKVEPWPDPENPPVPNIDEKSMKQVFKNMFVAKEITSGDIGLVIERIDWEIGEIYDYYRDDIDMFQVDANGYLIKHFYVKNRYDQVFKCLWNANGAISTEEPYFEPGTYGNNNIFQGVDGYKWKYMYTIDTGLKVKFMDDSWIPILSTGIYPNPLESSAGYGDIEVINVTQGGSGYDPANAVISVVITGDGTGAAGTVEVTDGVITDIIVTNPGTNYTYANVAIVSTVGSGAEAICPVSPVAGHGFDPIGELGVSHAMMTCEFNGSENGYVPTDIDFHQLGIVINPSSLSRTPLPANSTIYKTTTDLIVAPGFGLYTQDEFVFQGTSLENASFVGRVLSFDAAGNVLKVINTTGTLTTNAPVFGNTSATTRTLLSYSFPDFQIMSGYITYIENRTGIQRSDDGIEQIRLVLGKD